MCPSLDKDWRRGLAAEWTHIHALHANGVEEVLQALAAKIDNSLGEDGGDLNAEELNVANF